jgi:hypothetical protein
MYACKGKRKEQNINSIINVVSELIRKVNM